MVDGHAGASGRAIINSIRCGEFCSANSSHRVSTMVSSPSGFRQHEAAALVSTIESASIGLVAFEFATVLKSPNVFGTVPVTVKTGLEFLEPLIVYGMGVVLEYRSTDAKLNVDPPAAIRISPVTVVAGSAKN